MHPAADNILLLEHRNIAIESLYTSKDFNDCINKMEPEHLRDDLKQEVMLILMEKDPLMIVAMNNRNELKWYVVRTILNMVRSNSSPYSKKYRIITTDKVPEKPVQELNGRVVKELREQAVLHYINNELYWYDRAILQLYMKHGSYRKIEEETRIPWESCGNTIRKCIKKIRKEVLDVTE